eukprot:4944045-Karenia_brevis.AAC.1
MKRESIIKPFGSVGWPLVIYPGATAREGSPDDIVSAQKGVRDLPSSKTGDFDSAVTIGDLNSRKAKRGWLTQVVRKLYMSTMPSTD